ncbi:hypothetical protein CBR64_02830 [Cellulosimicrobium cellulans]|uniref:Uncharacterized protein n=1 Tax=Cellulosimicrobium cellulans TaxID=1710 RepID=A0A1Y0HTE8_CELCE|nr:hypothetical protein [Cellulosimicrobium cellulans]ARU50585.1 hypothetical protein CBR64_02830 [Cellulosimicrobium cellulans]
MTARRARPRPGLVPLLLAGACLLGVLWLWVLPGFRVQGATPFGETARVELAAGDHTVYADSPADWGDVRCEGAGPGGEDVVLRVSMSQQDLRVPRHWRAQSSFASDAGTVRLTCRSEGTTTAGTFAVGPSVDLLQSALGTVLLVAAVVLGVVGTARVRRRP